MAGLGFSERAPNYLSQRSADVVLSEVRPTKLTVDALRSVNVLLDELLWMILSTARSFSTDQLKIALNRILPTPLGKEALLEAEVELRAYWDRSATGTGILPYVENVHDFPLQPGYELLRIKCEAYSTFNDTDEDTEVEGRWLVKVENATGFSSSNKPYFAPAALYLTAIIEHICEHVLSNTGRVTARDSSRSQANLQDLFTALCEDETIYGLFKNMKVHDQIEMQSKAIAGRAQRAKSISRGTGEHSRTPSRSSASAYGSGSIGGTNEINHAPGSRTRLSSESAGSGTNFAIASPNSRGSLEKSKAKRLFGRVSADKDGSQLGHSIHPDSSHKRTDSMMSAGRRSATPLGDGPGSSPSANELEFDELMRSGTTMKVSLTPDRLKTFEVYNKEKGIRGGLNGIPLPTSASKLSQPAIKASQLAQDSSSDASPTDDHASDALKDAQMILRGVDSIVEGEEFGVYGTKDENGMVARSRKKSRGPPPVTYDTYEPPITTSSSSRNRSMSASQSSISASLGSRQAVGRKASLGAISPSSSPSNTTPPVSLMPKMSSSISSMTDISSRRRPSKRDSLEDILDGSSDDDMGMGKNKLKPKSAAGVSAQTRDLISFLNDGPPELPNFSQSVNLPPQEHRAKQGRFKSMVSRLTRGASSEKLSSSSNDDLNSPTRRSNGTQVHPPPAFHPPPLSAKKSLRNISTFAQNQALQQQALYPKPPPPPVVTPISPPLSPHQTPSNSLAESVPSSPGRIKHSSSRKAVPALSTPNYPQAENHLQAPIPPKKDGSLPSTPTRVISEASKPRMEAKTSSEDSISSSDTQTDSNIVPPNRKSSKDTSHLHVSSTSSKQSRRGLTPPSSPMMFATQAMDMRKLLSRATTADECRLLVDMFLAQSGMPMKPIEPQPDPAREPTADQQLAVVEALLSNNDSLQGERTEESSPRMDGEKMSLSFDTSHSLPTPRSIQHSPMTPSFRKPLPSPGRDVQKLTLSHTVVSAEA